MLHFVPLIVYGLGWPYFGRRFAGWMMVNGPDGVDTDKSEALFLGFFFGGFLWPIVIVGVVVTTAYNRGFFDFLIAEPREPREKREKRIEAERAKRIEQLERDTGIGQ